MSYKKALIIIILSLSIAFVYTASELDTKNNPKLQHVIVAIHNYYRSIASPSAANMIGLKWSEEAREFAEKSANTCIKGHSAGEDRQSDMFGPCGENLFFSWSSGQYKYTWFDAIEAWHSEKKDFTYGSKDYEFMAIGHYTAVMWASTSHIGCAYKNCDTPLEKRKPNWVQNKFACIYCTSGNYLDKIHMPYKRGKPCTDCPNDCFKSLCLNKCPLKNKLPEKYCKKDTGILFKKNKKGCNDVNVREKCPSTCDCSDRPYIQRWSQ